ncbi:MAG: enoyl-CoA hydratase/isomerase family protein, partial [Myxococcales bacterium]|nr:enoyl-CoA hydratase/isomerase family protein [Myxococcales bacterium]
FVANRIGTFGILSVFAHMEALGLGVDAVDAIFGPAMGRPKSAVFRTGDLVGLDTLCHVLDNVYDGAPDDEARERFKAPAWLQAMVVEGALGEKSGKGFYQKVKNEAGKSVILVRDLTTGQYAPSEKVRFGSIGKARNFEDVGDKIKALCSGDDAAAQLAWSCTAETLIYAANRIPEIADDVVNIDRAMRWGFAWDLGPFETWDALGVAESVARMEADGLAVPASVKAMLAAGRASFYVRDASGAESYWDLVAGEARPVPKSDRWLMLVDVKSDRTNIVQQNASATLLDLGDGVLGLEFHSKMNAIDEDIVNQYDTALAMLDDGDFEALVVGNQGGTAFCAGANLLMVGMAAMQGQWDDLEKMVERLQDVLQRAKYSSKPVVTAPRGLTLGGGCEIAMQSSATQAGAELYMGLVEVGVGLIPAGGGCKELLRRIVNPVMRSHPDADPLPHLQKIFQQ